MITDFSRYADGGILARVAVPSGDPVLAVYRSPVVYDNVTCRLILSVAGDTFASLAAIAYGDSTLWWKIADANPGVFFPVGIPPATELRVPLT